MQGYHEIAGKGIDATIDGHELRIGNSGLVFGDYSTAKMVTRVHLMIDGVISVISDFIMSTGRA